MNVLFTSYYKDHESFNEWGESTLLVAKRETKIDNVFLANSQLKGRTSGVEFLKFPKLRYVPVLYTIVTFFYFLYYILKYKIDWVYTHDLFTLYPAYLVCRLLRKRQIVTVHACWFCCNGFYRYHDGYFCKGRLSDALVAYPIWKWGWEIYKHYGVVFSRFLLRRVDVIAVSEFIQHLLADYGINSKVDYSQNLYDLRYVKGARKIKKYYGKKVVLFVGELTKAKGVDLLVEAFTELDRSGSVLVIVGSGPLEGHLKKLAKGFKVEFIPSAGKKKLFDYFKSASIIVYPVLRSEGYSKVIEVAKEMGKPVIATINSSFPEQLRFYDNSFLVSNLDVNALIFALKKVFARNK